MLFHRHLIHSVTARIHRIRTLLISTVLITAFSSLSQGTITMALREPGSDIRTDQHSNAGFGFYTPVTGVRINRLGYWDRGGDGLASSHDVMIVRYNGGSSYVELARATIPAGTTGRLEGGYRWVAIPEILLPDLGQDADYYGLVSTHGGDPWTESLGPALPMNPAVGTSASSLSGLQSGGLNAGSLQVIGDRPSGWGGANMGFENLAPTPEKRLRIMPLGDSITVGFTDAGWHVPFEFGYRGHLARMLDEAGVPFLFVGGSSEPFTGAFGDPTRGGTAYPVNELRDPQIGQSRHRGTAGIGIYGVNVYAASWIKADEPDMILLMVGINGVNSESPSQIATLMNTIYSTKPDVAVVVAQITPMSIYSADLIAYNTYIRETLVPTLKAQGKKISTVDQHRNFLTDPADNHSIDPTKFSNGFSHPTNSAYELMARSWFPAVASLALDRSSIPAGVVENEPIATLRNPGAPEEVLTYTLSSGNGGEDNTKFRIQGNQVIAGDHPFHLDPPGRTYDIRISATGSAGGPLAQKFVLNRMAPVAQSPQPVLISTASSGDESHFSGEILGNDLLHGLDGVHLNYQFMSGLPGPQINDGLHGGNGDPTAVTWASDRNISSSTYYLGTGNGAGYDVSSVTSVAAWSNAGFMNQKYKISVRYAGASLFTTEPGCLIDYQPVTNVTGNGPAGSTKVRITRPGGMLFRKIDAIRFTMLDTKSQQGGGVTMREIDVVGTVAAIADPVITSLDVTSLAQGEASFAWTSNLGKTYKIETSSSLGASWATLEAAYPSAGLSTRYRDTTIMETDDRRFYRITENP